MYVILEALVLLSFFIFLAIPTGDITQESFISTAPTKLELKQWKESTFSPTALKVKIKSSTELNEKWWGQYKLAQIYLNKNHPKKACPLFSSLSVQSKFPLNKLASIRALESCTHYSKSYGLIQKVNLNQVSPWLKNNAVDIYLQHAVAKNDDYEIMQLSYEKSKQGLPKNKKIQLTSDALELAKKLYQHTFAKKMADRLLRLQSGSKPGVKTPLERARFLLKSRKFNLAEKQYKKIIKNKRSSFMTRYKAYWGLRKSAKLQLKTDKYIKATEELARFVRREYLRYKSPSKSLIQRFHNTQITLARTYWTKNKIKKAKRTLKTTQQLLKNRFSLAKIMFIQARIAEEKQKFAASTWWLKESLKQKKMSQSLYESTLWLKAWNHRKLSEYKKAIRDFNTLLNITKDSSTKHRAQYWLAKTYTLTENSTEAREIFQSLTLTDSVGFYGLLAARELGNNLTTLLQQGPLTAVRVNLNQSGLIKNDYIKWLLAVDEPAVAGHYLKNISKTMRRNNNEELSDWLNVFNYYLQSKQYQSMFSSLGLLKKKLRHQILDRNPEIFFPKPYGKTIQSAAKKFGVTPSMLYAIMRQESAFNPNARSHADAFGLMQMLPPVAKYTANRYRLSYQKPSDLYKPFVNIPLGAAFLKELFNRHEGQFILAVASYNASEKAIRNWMRTRYRGDSLEFIEDIPYKETKSYVRLVMRNFIYYEILNQTPNYVAFPEWALTLQVAAR